MGDAVHRNLHVFVCTTVGRHHCGGQGSEHILQRLRDEVERRDLHWVRTTRMGCNQQHHQGPILIVYPDGVWYGRLQVADVDEIIADKGMVRIIATIFGRPTPLELEYWQIEKL